MRDYSSSHNAPPIEPQSKELTEPRQFEGGRCGHPWPKWQVIFTCSHQYQMVLKDRQRQVCMQHNNIKQ